MSKPLKIFVHDRGWSGADVFVSHSRELATRELVDPEIVWDFEQAVTHDRVHPPELKNPHWKRHLALIEKRDTVLDEYDIVEGLEINTLGDN
jgi:hypothetical protein